MALFIIETTNTNTDFDVVVTALANNTFINNKNIKTPSNGDFRDGVTNIINQISNSRYESVVFNVLDYDNEVRYIDTLYDIAKDVELSIGIRTKTVQNPAKLKELGIPYIIDDKEITPTVLVKECAKHARKAEVGATLDMCYMAMPVEKSFREKLIQYINRSGRANADIYNAAGISKQVFSKIISSDDYEPKKSTILCLIIGLRMDMDDALDLLNAAGYTLSKSIITDVVIRSAIESKDYDMNAINIELVERGRPAIGWTPRD